MHLVAFALHAGQIDKEGKFTIYQRVWQFIVEQQRFLWPIPSGRKERFSGYKFRMIEICS